MLLTSEILLTPYYNKLDGKKMSHWAITYVCVSQKITIYFSLDHSLAFLKCKAITVLSFVLLREDA